uniref:hypothetical protein n=1 Tax=Paractinoplanes polyasparticus TaxID=2856853 RepID=UPI001C841E87|nr:hypothetical protein [Actinoplanes polyasparticus]
MAREESDTHAVPGRKRSECSSPAHQPPRTPPRPHPADVSGSSEIRTGRPAPFDVAISADASTDAVRTGRVYALTEGQAAQARVFLDRQSRPTGNDDDCFDDPPGEAKSKGVRMPY